MKAIAAEKTGDLAKKTNLKRVAAKMKHRTLRTVPSLHLHLGINFNYNFYLCFVLDEQAVLKAFVWFFLFQIFFL